MEAITVQALTTVAGLAIVVGMIVFILRKALNLTSSAMNRYGALISVAVAIVLAIAAGFALNLVSGSDLLQGMLNGLAAGLLASGGYDVVNGANKAVQNDG